jgi:hypothetical protein
LNPAGDEFILKTSNDIACRTPAGEPFIAGPRWLALACLAVGFTASGAEVVALDRLPPPSPAKVNFDVDIKPILEQSCLRCHGPEKPKSHFRLDNREGALKGGNENTDDIVPGDSAHSRLIQYVAHLVADMEMPPVDKGKPLSSQQIATLRAWIDQGANWSGTNAGPALAFSVTPELRWIGVSGDKGKFREIEGTKEGTGGGSSFSLQEKLSPDRSLSAEGHFLFPDQNFQLKLALVQSEVGFVRGGFEQWRKYYDDTGGVDRAMVPSSFSLGRDLHVDDGRAWIDFGLTLPRWPEIVLGYEYRFRTGDEATLDWGESASGKNIVPATKALDEQTHLLKLDVAYEAATWRVEDNARVEFYRQQNRGIEATTFGTGPAPDTYLRSADNYRHVEGANSLSLEKQVRDWWLLSGGYFYSQLQADGSMNQTTTDAAGAPVNGNFWSSRVTLSRESHVFSVASLLTPLNYLSLSLGTQNEWTREDGFGHTHLDSGDPNDPALFSLYSFPAVSDLDQFQSMQNANLRFTKIPFTILFADARWQQDRIGQFGSGQLLETGSTTTPTPFARDTEFSNNRFDTKAGFTVSPWRWIELNGQFRHLVSDSDYNQLQDTTPNGYPAFILGRKIVTDQADARLALRPASWLKTALTYQLVRTDYSTRTDPPGSPALLAGNENADVYGVNVALTPRGRFYFYGAFTYSDSQTITATHGNPSVVPYRGNVYTALANVTYAWNDSTELNAAYSFSRADYGQNNFANGVPLGLDYTRHGVSAGLGKKINPRVSLNLHYAFFQYSEPAAGRVNDYTAHGIFATLAIKWP